MNTKLLYWYSFGGNIPRKVKKMVLGTKERRSVIRRMLSETVAQWPITTMYERRDFHPHGAFCPNCGERSYIGEGSRELYPNHWEKFHCIRCRKVVGYIDNSPFIHALECKDNDYNPQF